MWTVYFVIFVILLYLQCVAGWYVRSYILRASEVLLLLVALFIIFLRYIFCYVGTNCVAGRSCGLCGSYDSMIVVIPSSHCYILIILVCAPRCS